MERINKTLTLEHGAWSMERPGRKAMSENKKTAKG